VLRPGYINNRDRGAQRVQSVASGVGGMARTEQSLPRLMSHNPNHETGGNRTVGHLAATFGVTILWLDALGASAFKERIGRPGQMSASSTHVPSLRPNLANHHLELAALDAIGAAHKRYSRLVGCFWSGHGLVHLRNEVLVVENDVEK